MLFEITVKEGFEVKAHIVGRVRLDTAITVDDLNQVIQVEQWLEKMTGLRWHIHSINV